MKRTSKVLALTLILLCVTVIVWLRVRKQDVRIIPSNIDPVQQSPSERRGAAEEPGPPKPIVDSDADSEYKFYQTLFEPFERGLGWLGTGDAVADYKLRAKYATSRLTERIVSADARMLSAAKLSPEQLKQADAVVKKHLDSLNEIIARNASYKPDETKSRAYYEFKISPYFTDDRLRSALQADLSVAIGSEKASIICSSDGIKEVFSERGKSEITVKIDLDMGMLRYTYRRSDGTGGGGGNGGPGAVLEFGGKPLNMLMAEVIYEIKNGAPKR